VNKQPGRGLRIRESLLAEVGHTNWPSRAMQNSAFLFIHLLTFLRKLCIFFLGWSKDPGPSTGEEVPRFFCGEMLLEGTKCIY
jgi:hypothetical protein